MKLYLWRFRIAVLLFLIPWPASAQTLESSLGRVEVGPDYVGYSLQNQKTMVPRDILAVLPRQGRFQNTADDIALLFDVAQMEGKPIPQWTPAADDSVLTLLDSVATVAASVKAELASKDEQLQIALAAADSMAGALFAYRDTIAANRETITQLTSAVAAKDIVIGDLSLAVERERENTEAFRRVVDQVARHILAVLNSEGELP